MAASISPAIRPSQVLVWGGNIAYFGALVGWMVSDAFQGLRSGAIKPFSPYKTRMGQSKPSIERCYSLFKNNSK